MREIKGPGQLCVQNERARAALCAGGRGQSHPVCEMKGPVCGEGVERNSMSDMETMGSTNETELSE